MMDVSAGADDSRNTPPAQKGCTHDGQTPQRGGLGDVVGPAGRICWECEVPGSGANIVSRWRGGKPSSPCHMRLL